MVQSRFQEMYAAGFARKDTNTSHSTQFRCGLQSGCHSLEHHTCAVAEYLQRRIQANCQIVRNPKQIAQLLPLAMSVVVVQS
jgi:hypothetical protein